MTETEKRKKLEEEIDKFNQEMHELKRKNITLIEEQQRNQSPISNKMIELYKFFIKICDKTFIEK